MHFFVRNMAIFMIKIVDWKNDYCRCLSRRTVQFKTSYLRPDRPLQYCHHSGLDLRGLNLHRCERLYVRTWYRIDSERINCHFFARFRLANALRKSCSLVSAAFRDHQYHRLAERCFRLWIRSFLCRRQISVVYDEPEATYALEIHVSAERHSHIPRGDS